MRKLNYLAFIILSGLMISSCAKEQAVTTNNNTTKLMVRLTDAPGPYDAVNVDMKSVEVLNNDGTTTSLQTNAGVYNVLAFAYGSDKLLACGPVDMTRAQKLRVIMGGNNSIVLNNATYPMIYPSAVNQTEVLIPITQTQPATDTSMMLLDLDVNSSVSANQNSIFLHLYLVLLIQDLQVQ